MKAKKVSLKIQLLEIFIFAAIIPMIITALFLYRLEVNRTLNAEILSQRQILELTASNMLQKISHFNNLTSSVYYNNAILKCLENGKDRALSSYEKMQIQLDINSMMRTDDHVLSFSLTTMSGDTLYWNDGYSNVVNATSLNPDFLKKIYDSNGSGVLSDPITHIKKRKFPSSAASIYYGRLIRSTEHNFGPIGILLIEIDISSFEDIISTSGFKSEAILLITSENNTLIWGYLEDLVKCQIGEIIPEETLSAPSGDYSVRTINGNKYYCFYSMTDSLNYNCYSLLPVPIIKSAAQYIRIVLLLISVVNFICLLLIFSLCTKQIITPIQHLSIIMHNQNYMNYFPIPDYPVQNEIGYLYESFQEMSTRTLHLVEQLKESSKKEARQQLALLHAQLNPHFLYNTLDSINWMAQNENAKKIPEVINALSQILRYSIIKDNDFVFVSDELQWLKNYIYIQNIRFQDSFSIEYNIAENIMNYKIPRFILQPFIENSLLHGFSEIHQGGIIKLNIYSKQNDLFLIIEDNGKGMTESAIYTVLYGNSSGIGIGNTNAYIKKKFGRPYGIQIISKLAEGTKIMIRLPVQK